MIDLLNVQVIIGNTKDGWPIGPACKDMAKLARDSYSQDGITFMECGNCRILLLDDHFEGGCPNCGNKGKFNHIDTNAKGE